MQLWPIPSKSVDCLKKCVGELPTDPTWIMHDDLWSRRLCGVEFVSFEVITGMVLEVESRMKIEACRDRARVNAEVRKWASRLLCAPRRRRTLI